MSFLLIARHSNLVTLKTYILLIMKPNTLRAIMPLLLLLLLNCWNCKEKESGAQAKQLTVQKKPLSKTVKELASFGGIALNDTLDINQLMVFKKVNREGKIDASDLETVTSLFKALEKSKTQEEFPIIEIVAKDQLIFGVSEKGFQGSIWAILLVDKPSGKIIKVEFKHKAESEGYGAGITRKSFSKQFLGSSVLSEGNAFGLIQKGEPVIEGEHKIDGVAGATITSKSVISMMNEGLQVYSTYLNY